MDNRIIYDHAYYCDAGSHYGMYGVPLVGTLYMSEDEYEMFMQNGITISVTRGQDETT